jgi:hypothetical protein
VNILWHIEKHATSCYSNVIASSKTKNKKLVVFILALELSPGMRVLDQQRLLRFNHRSLLVLLAAATYPRRRYSVCKLKLSSAIE